MASSRERYNNIVASEKTTTVSARDRYNALKQIENANDRLVSAVNFINNNAGISSDANTDGSTDIRDVVRSKNITNQATEHINAINDIRSAYDVLERYSKQRGGSLAGYQENSKNLKELKELLTGAKQYGEENSKLLKDVLSGAYAKRLATEQTVQMLESIDTSSPTVFAKQQQYKQNNPNLYALMGGRAYNPIPSVNPTQLTKEDLEKVQTAQAWDKARRELIEKKNAAAKTNSETQKKNELSGAVGWLQSFANDYMQGEKKQSTASPTYSAEDIEYIVSAAMSDDEQKALQAAKNRYKDTAYFAKMMGAKAPENKQDNSAKDVIGRINASQKRMNNLEGDYSSDEVKAINKYARLYAQYTGLAEPEDAFSTLARLTGDLKNNEAYQISARVNQMKAEKINEAIKLPGTNIDVPFLKDIVDLGARGKWGNMYTAFSNLSPESQEGYLRANIISPLEGEKFIEAHEDEIIYNRALKLYNEAINGNGIQRASAQLGIFIEAGIESGLGGLAKGLSMAVGETPEAEPMSINQTANNMLSQYYADNNKRLSKVIQDVVVNAVQNQSVAIGGTLIGIATGNPMAGNIAGNILFGVSVFGNNYEDAVRNGAESQNATVYALSTAALETSLGIALGAIPGAKGFLTGTVLSDISKKVANPAAKFILKMTARFAGESIEEGLQQAIDPFLRNAMLNEKNDTIFNSKSAWKDVGYSSLIGGLSAMLLSGGATISEIQTEKQTESYGQAFKQFSDEYDVSVKDLAKYAKEISEEKSELYKTADGILSGKLEESDYNVGLLYTGAVKEIYDAGRVVTELVGNKVMNTENGISDLIAQYDEVTEKGFEFPDIVKLQVDTVRRKQESGSEVSAYEVGRMARTIPLYAARAAIETAIAQDSELQSTANNESAITPNEEATVENLADQAQEVDKVSVAENKSIGFTEPSTKDIYREPTAEERYEAVLGKRKTAKQRHILDVAKALDKNLKVVFVPKNSNVLNDKNGKYVFNTNTMYLAEDLDVVESYLEVFKHEFMHRLELKKAYDSFKAYLFNKSDAFGRYAQTRMAYDDKKKERGTIERTREDAINDLINMYLDNFKGDKKIPQSVRDNFTREKAEREAVADFVARTLFKGNTANLRVALSEDLESLVNMETDLELFEEMAKNDRNLLQKIIDAIRDFINDIKGVPQFKDLEQDLRYIEERLTRVYNSADMINGRSNVDNEVYDIVALENGNTYVKASRNIITGTTIKQQRAQITNFFKKLLKNKPSIDIPTIEGDILTLTMKDTEDKARDNFGTVNGQPVKLSKEEFAVKLRIESHIDEIAETAIKKNKPLTPDVKNHDFAKDGFEYRTAYFEDFDGKYYKIDFSIGHNGTVATVYNIGKIKEDVPPSAKIIAVVGSQALDSSSSTDIIRNKNENVNKNSSNESYFSDNFTTSKDSDGKQLTKAQEVFFKDSASVDDNGNLLVMYQGSQEEFNEFDRKKSSPFNLYGRGFYFTSSKSHAAQYGNVTRAYYLNIKNPVPTYKGDSIITKQQIKKYLEVVAENEDYSIENYGTYDINKIVDSVYGKSDYAMLQDISATAIGDLVEAIELFNKVNGTKFDGLILATETIIFNSEQAKLTTNLNPTESKDIRYSSDDISELQRDLYNRHRNGKLTDEEYITETDKLWEKANKTYGTLPKGENAKIDANVPAAVAKDKPTERFIRGIIETDTLKGEALKGMEERTLLGDFSYKVVSDEKAIKTANVAFENGTAESIWEDTVNVGTGITKNKIAIGEALLTNAIKENNTFEILKYSAELADIFTRAGQVVQAARLLKKMTGAGRLVSLQRTVKTLNKDLIKKYGEEFPPIKISEESAKRLADAKTVIGIEQAYQEILQEVADQMPVTFMDKWNAWRYFAMLANPKTHIRNLIGNVIFVPTVRIKDAIAAGIEAATIEDKSKRTKSLVIKKEYRDFAKKDSSRKDVKELLRGNKYNDKTAISEKQKIFKTEVLNFLTEFNSNALEAEDMWAKNKHYIHALAGFLQARGVDLNNVSNKVLDEARIYAVKEARKATFNDVSAFANAIQRFANKNLAANLLVEGVLPFKRTPINIVKRGIEYSPIGLIKTLTKGVLDVKKGNITATEFIDGLASGLTGTGILLTGMLFNALGWVVGGEDDDDKSQFEKLLGKQEYAVEFFGSSYTIDWAAPACIPFFIGVEIMNSVNENEGFELSQFGNAVWNSLEPITNLSMLSGIQSVIESTRYADNTQTFSAIAIDSLTSYAMQGIPSLSGAIARTIDPTQRSWYVDKNDKWLDTTAQTVKNNLQSKIPGLTYTQTAKVDAWGRKVSRGGTAERILENFVSPGYYSKINYDEVEQELLRINSVTGESIFPKSASKSFEVNGETKHLSAKEWELYAILKGQYSFKYIKEFKESKYYDKLDDFERTEVIKDLYSFANAKAKGEVSEYDIFSVSTYKTAAKYDKNGKLIPYYVSKAIEYVRKKRKEEKE